MMRPSIIPRIGDRIKIWITGEGPVSYTARIVGMWGIGIVAEVQVIAQDGRLAPAVLRPGQFVIAYDQSLPPEEK